MKLSETYLASNDIASANITKSLKELKEVDLLDPKTIMNEVESVITYYRRRQVLELDRAIPDFVRKGVITFMKPDREAFPSTMINTIPAVITIHPKKGKPVAILESRSCIKAVIDRSTADKRIAYEINDQYTMFNAILGGSILYVLNAKPIDFNSSSNGKIAKGACIAFGIIFRRIIDKMFTLGSTTDSMMLDLATHCAIEWFAGNVLDMKSADDIEALALRSTGSLSLKGWNAIPPSYDTTLRSKLINTDFKGLCELVPKMTGIPPIKMAAFISEVAQLFGAAIPNSMEYLPFFAAHICGIDTATMNSGVNYSNLKNAFKGQSDVIVFRDGIIAHVNKHAARISEAFGG